MTNPSGRNRSHPIRATVGPLCVGAILVLAPIAPVDAAPVDTVKDTSVMRSSDSESATPAMLLARALRQKNGGSTLSDDTTVEDGCRPPPPSGGGSLASFRMPLQRIRITSEFGSRVHPVHGTLHSHTGVDLAAPKGTPVLAAANGTVGSIGTKTALGKYIVILHANGYATTYGHLSAFAPDLRIGSPVTRGEHIGAVGSTGTVTGPHLHFEVRVNNRPVNPMTLAGKPDGTDTQQGRSHTLHSADHLMVARRLIDGCARGTGL